MKQDRTKRNSSPESLARLKAYNASAAGKARRRAYEASAAFKAVRKDRRYKHTSEIKRLYGLSREDYDSMLAAQGNACAICEKAFNGKRLFVDHDHVTGRVRGLLCCRCNFMLGYAKDNIKTLRAAIHYLKRAG